MLIFIAINIIRFRDRVYFDRVDFGNSHLEGVVENFTDIYIAFIARHMFPLNYPPFLPLDSKVIRQDRIITTRRVLRTPRT